VHSPACNTYTCQIKSSLLSNVGVKEIANHNSKLKIKTMVIKGLTPLSDKEQFFKSGDQKPT
jgi:hypothetical protein